MKTNKTALITGAAKRIGRGTALALAGQGINIAAHYNTSDEEAGTLRESILERGVQCEIFRMDFSSPEQTGELFEKVITRFQRIDYIINSASVFPVNRLADIDFDEIRRNINVNALAPFFLIRLFYRHIRESGGEGRVVNFLDATIKEYDRSHAAYHLSKRMFFSLTRMMSLEFAPELKINGIAPGLILPPEGETEEYLEKLSNMNPLKTYGSLKEITDAVLFLINSSFITGQIIFVDGGYHLKGNVYDL